MKKWFTKDWWSFLLEKPKNRSWAFDNRFLDRLNVIWCRIKGHPCGVVWYSSGSEPDMSCKNCGEDLG